LPPVIEEYKGTAAVYLKKILALTRGDHPQLVGLSPEGRTGPNATLCQPPTGAGLFLELLAHNQIPLLPVGFFQDDENAMVANFGKPFKLNVARHLTREQRDGEASRQAMVEIGKLLPEKMWGEYTEDIRRTRESVKSQNEKSIDAPPKRM